MALALLLPACSDGGRDIRDGEPRLPDDQGVVTDITTASITLDGERTYGVSKDLAAFDTYTRTLEPMLGRKDQYVQVGLDGETMVWMAGIGAVVATLDPPSAFYNGDLVDVTDHAGRRAAVFADGTVLHLDDALEAPGPGVTVQARIDVQRHVVIEIGGALRAPGPTAPEGADG